MLPRTISHTTPYGIVAVCHAASLIGLWALNMQVGRCCGFQPLTFLLCASTNIGTENVLSQLVNELMNKCPPPLFSVADLKAGVFILPSPSSAIVPHLAFSSFCFFSQSLLSLSLWPLLVLHVCICGSQQSIEEGAVGGVKTEAECTCMKFSKARKTTKLNFKNLF